MPKNNSKLKTQNSKVQVKTEKVTQIAKKTTNAKLLMSNLSVPMINLDGTKPGTLSLPKEIFGAKINEKLLAQALRVYLANSKSHFGHTKTRGEVKGSTRKIRAQKGTGGARHGSIRAPIFIGGGIAFGPKFRNIKLELPKKMKKAAIISALSEKAKEKEVIGVSGLEKLSGKTKEMARFLKKNSLKSILFISSSKNEKLQRSIENLPEVESRLFDQVNIFELIKYQTIALDQESVKKLEERILKAKE